MCRWPRLIPALFILTLLSACAKPYPIPYQPYTDQLAETDRDLANYIDNKFRHSPWLQKLCADRCHFQIDTYYGVGLITGQVPTQSTYEAVSRLIANAPDAIYNFNRTEVRPSIGWWQRSEDAWLTSEVKTALLFASGVPSGAVKVITQNGVVYLMGNLGASQQRHAIHTARRVDGVKKVVTLMQLPVMA